MSRVQDARTHESLGTDALFLVWGPPGYGPRSRAFGAALGIEVAFITVTRRRGRLSALVKYPVQAVRTLALLVRRSPRVIFVQSPPGFAVMTVWLYATLGRRRFVVDAHSDAMTSRYWTKPRWVYRGLARAAAATLVTNEHFAASIRADGGTSLVIRDVPQSVDGSRRDAAAPGAFGVMVVCTYAPDEPIEEVFEAAGHLPEVTFSLTGDPARFGRVLPPAPPNVRRTGYLSEEAYRDLMASSGAVMCLTTNDHTMQRGACEALWTGRPIITSDWPLLRDYFDRGTEHVDNGAASIAAAVRKIAADPTAYERAIEDLQALRRREWDEAVAALVTLVGARGAFPPAHEEDHP